VNYLAHSVLSFGQSDIMVGNMISDFIKGKKQYDYPAGIRRGILLHRFIDQFTDNHLATKQAAVYLKPVAGRYAYAFVDVVYDHFLATDINFFPDKESLSGYVLKVYEILMSNSQLLPEKFAAFLPYMVQQNWLYNYQYNSGVEKSFRGLAKRAAFPVDPIATFNTFKTHYNVLRSYYDVFMPEVKIAAEKRLTDLLMVSNTE
jgi:acyl carrier protein phosphodiesterase